MNRVTLTGFLGADPEIRTTQTGNKCANIRVATSEVWRDKQSGEKRERTEWHQVIVWNEALVEKVVPLLQKGSRVLIEGKLQTRSWEDVNIKGRDGQPLKRWATEIVLQNFDARIELMDRQPSNRPPPMDGPDQGRPYQPRNGRSDHQAPLGAHDPDTGEIPDDYGPPPHDSYPQDGFPL